MHTKKHCRFNFPKPPSARTFISRSSFEDQEGDKKCQMDGADQLADCACKIRKKNKVLEKQIANSIITKIKDALSDDNASFDSVEQLFSHLNVNQRRFERAYNICAKKTHIVLRRQVRVYSISYISKAEREMGLLLANAQREVAKDKSSSAKDALKSLGSVYLHNRDVCAQEAVYRLTTMHLKECSRKVVFVPVGENNVKMSLPLSVLKQKASSDDLTTEDMWTTSSVDRYKNRPRDGIFNDVYGNFCFRVPCFEQI
ncbi:hypothetical protein N1851_025288 [Merluccius polli]|uniref:Uncharacterized protein n=1 Tax=Merluccius polli TaxID=89951 RepID=A0AA47MDZ8_MERPO|nr:hypothetical protein N1851_025288 [Merluccius polli]